MLFEYERTQDDELSLRVGDIIRNVRNVSEILVLFRLEKCSSPPSHLLLQVDEGWCEGELNGAHGMFPDNFVKILSPSAPAPSHQPPPPVSSEPPSSSVPLRSKFDSRTA